MTWLEVVNLRDGAVVDWVTLTSDGQISFRTGAAESIFESLRSVDDSLTDAEIFEARTGWTNGYVMIRPAEPERSDADG